VAYQREDSGMTGHRLCLACSRLVICCRRLARQRHAGSGQNRKRLPDIRQREPGWLRSSRLTILTWRLTRRLPEGSREIGLAGKAERKRYVHQGPIAMDQHGFRALEALGTDVPMGRFSDGLSKGSRKMVSAQARNRCHAFKAKIAFQVRINIVQHTKESALIEPLVCTTRKKLSA
jgi:hypothetical protein